MKYKRLFTLLIALLDILLVIASLFVRSPWVGYFSWRLMVLSLGGTWFPIFVPNNSFVLPKDNPYIL